MIVVDARALIAILDEEPDAAAYAKAMADADPPLVPAATALETGLVMVHRQGSKAIRKVNGLIQEAGFQIAPSGTSERGLTETDGSISGSFHHVECKHLSVLR